MTAGGAALDREVTVELPDGLADEQEHGWLQDAVQDRLVDLWAELGLPRRPRVRVDPRPDGRFAGVALDGRPLPLSARRRHAVAVAVTGVPHQFGEPAEVEPFLRWRAAAAPAESRKELVVQLVEATIAAALADVVAGEASALAVLWLAEAGSGTVELAARGIALAGELGVAPSQLDLASLAAAVDGGPADLYPVPGVRDARIGRGRQRPAGPGARVQPPDAPPVDGASRQSFRSTLTAGNDRSPATPRVIRQQSLSHFGVALPDVTQAISDDLPRRPLPGPVRADPAPRRPGWIRSTAAGGPSSTATPCPRRHPSPASPSTLPGWSFAGSTPSSSCGSRGGSRHRCQS